MATKLEINFGRLLNRCELLANDKENMNWRLEKYVGALQDYLCDLKKSTSKPSNDVLTEYSKKVDLLKGIIEAEKLPSASEKAMAVDLLASAPKLGQNVEPSKKLHIQAKARHHKDVRDELMGTSKSNTANGGVRLRKPGAPSGGASNVEEDIDTVLRHHHAMQDKLADEMVHLAQNLKENARVAGRIVKEDTQKLEHSSNLAAKNFDKLKVESERLDTHVQKSCNWWIWIMLVVVIVTFINMILFMRLFPKKS